MAEAENKAAEPCGGCGETNPHRRCIGCLHEFLPKPPHQEEGEASDAIQKLNAIAEAYHDYPVMIGGVRDAVSALLSQASQIEALRKERDEARLCQKQIAAGSNQSATVARIIIAKNEADGRAETAETKLAEAVEQAFRDGLAYGTNVRNADPDLAWGHSRAKAFLHANGGGQ